MTTSNRIFSVFSFITFVFCCIPLRRHMQAWNIGICLNMAWTALACLNYFINSVIWNDNVNNPAPVWCDISSRIYLSSIIAIPVAVLCTTRRVYLITIGHMPLTTTQKHRAIMLDLALGLGIPLIFVILMYIPQRKRFIIFEDIGCSIAIDDDPISMVIGSGSQVVVSLACAAYSTLTIYTIYQKYSGLSELLSSNNTIDMSQYVRVLIIATLSSICVVPVALYMLVNNWITANSWPGLKVIHSDFSPVLVPASVWRSVQVAKYSPEIRRWGFVFNGFVIFACFGIHKEARRRYRLTAYHVFQCVSCFRVKNSRTSADHDTKPAPAGLLPLVFAHNRTPQRLKFLDFSPNKTRVIVDIGGALPPTQVSFSSMTTNSDCSDCCMDRHHTPSPYDNVLETVVVAPPAARIATRG